jgi:hypothetical protein
MKSWAQRNPFLARVLLRFVLRLGVALAVVFPAMPLAERYGVSPNVAAIAAVVIGLVLGAKLAEMVAAAWGLPDEVKPGKRE